MVEEPAPIALIRILSVDEVRSNPKNVAAMSEAKSGERSERW